MSLRMGRGGGFGSVNAVSPCSVAGIMATGAAKARSPVMVAC